MLVNVAKTLAAFQETFETPPTPFDRFRDALARGERPRAGTYSEAAQRGLKVFVGKGTCSSCHSGPNFTNAEFRNNGFSADPGRPEGLKVAQASRFNLAGRYNDDPLRAVRAIQEPEAAPSRCPRCDTCCSPHPMGTTASAKRSLRWCGTTRRRVRPPCLP